MTINDVFSYDFGVTETRNSCFILQYATFSFQLISSNMDVSTTASDSCQKTIPWGWFNRRTCSRSALKTMRIFSVIDHVSLKEIIAMDVTRDSFVLAHQFTSFTVKKTFSRYKEHTISFMCLSSNVNEDAKGQSCFIMVITDRSSQEWRNVVTPATDCHLSFH